MSRSKNIGRGKNTKNQPVVTNPELRGRDKAKMNKYQKEDLITKVIEWILAGIADKPLKNNISTEAPVQLSEDEVSEFIRLALARVAEITQQDASVTIANHIEKYEFAYNYFHTIGHAQGAAKALKAKEKLLGILKAKSIVINHNKKTVINRVVEYDTSIFNTSEQKRVKELLDKITIRK